MTVPKTLMRWWSVMALCAILVLQAPVQAQQTQATLLSEDAGDVSLEASTQEQAPPSGHYDQVDLLSLDFEEGKDEFYFTLQVADLKTEFMEDGYGTYYFVTFRHLDTLYGLEMEQWLDFTPGGETVRHYWADLAVYDPDQDDWSDAGRATLEADEEAGTLRATVPREYILDREGATPFPGRTLDQFRVEAFSSTVRMGSFSINGIPVSGDIFARDAMPDDGPASVTWPVQYGVEQTGHARLHSDEPFRFSNGEASTFVFKVHAINTGETPDRFDIKFSGAAADWDVRTPSSIVNVPAEDMVEVPVVLRTEFGHNHGERTRFLMEMTSRSDPTAVGRIELGIHYPEVPQPAGHHNELYLHSTNLVSSDIEEAFATIDALVTGRDRSGRAYMNAHDDPQGELGDEDVPVRGEECAWQDDDLLTSNYCWWIPLSPALKMGLDFDLDRTGTINIPITTTLPMPDLVVSGTLYHERSEQVGEDEWEWTTTPAATFASDPESVEANSGTTVTAMVVPSPEADLLPYAERQYMWLELHASFMRPENFFGIGVHDVPVLQPGGKMDLPLLEYSDPIEEVFQTVGAVQLIAEEQEKLVNPGETVVYEVTLQNTGGLEEAFLLDIVGENDQWAQLLSKRAVTLAAGETKKVAVAVSPPGSAKDDARIDLILQAGAASDPQSRALVRLLTIVDTDEDHPDEGEKAGLLQEQDQKAPGPWAGGALLVALAALLLRRRT